MEVTQAWGGVERACPVAVYFAVQRNTAVGVVCRGLCKPSQVAGAAKVPCGLLDAQRAALPVPGGGGDARRLFDGECVMPEAPSSVATRRAAGHAAGVSGGAAAGGGGARARRMMRRMEAGVAVPAASASGSAAPAAAG